MSDFAERIWAQVISWGVVSALTAIITAVVNTLLLRTRLKNIGENIGDHDKRIGENTNRISKIEIACPNHRMDLVSKDEMVRAVATIQTVGYELGEQIAETDRHNEQRISAVHNRVNKIEASLGELRGQVTGANQ